MGSELTREEFLSSQQTQLESFEKASERNVSAIRDLGKDLREAMGGSEKSNGYPVLIGLVLTIMLTLFGTSITLIIASHMIFQGQIDSVGGRINAEREDRISADTHNDSDSQERHADANESIDSRHDAVMLLISQGKREMMDKIHRMEDYYDEIVLSAMRRLGNYSAGIGLNDRGDPSIAHPP